MATALAYQAKTAVTMHGGRERVQELRLVASDTGATIGDGVDVRGRVIDLLVAASGRPVAAGALDGPGAARLLAMTE